MKQYIVTTLVPFNINRLELRGDREETAAATLNTDVSTDDDEDDSEDDSANESTSDNDDPSDDDESDSKYTIDVKEQEELALALIRG